MKSSQVWGNTPSSRWELKNNAAPSAPTQPVEAQTSPDTSAENYNILKSAVVDFLDGEITEDDLDLVLKTIEDK
jgi:hypothetical protein